jgi:chromosome segregation ATPase
MAEFDPQLLFEMLKRLQSDVTQLGARMDKLDGRLDRLEGRLTRIEDRMEHLESRVSAVNHLAQSVLVEIVGINKRVENFTAEMLQIDRRIAALEVRA